MFEEPVEPKKARGAALIETAREDLDLYSVGDLKERIETLQGEIARTRAAIDRKKDAGAAADAFFSLGKA